MANSTKSPQTVPLPVLIVASLAGMVVALGAAVVSYAHMHELCLAAGDSELLARITPLLVDGMVVFASALLYAQKRLGERVEWLAVVGVLLGVAASLGANIVSKVPEAASSDAVRLTVAAWPPLALGIVGHLAWQLLAIALRGRHKEAPPASVEIGQQVNIGTMNVGSQEVPHGPPGDVPATQPEALLEPSRSLPTGRPVIDTSSRPGPSRNRVRKASGKALSDDDWVPFAKHVREALAAEGKPFTPNALKERAKRDGTSPGSLGHDRATRLVTHLQEATS
jgi:hypothetical protein